MKLNVILIAISIVLVVSILSIPNSFYLFIRGGYSLKTNSSNLHIIENIYPLYNLEKVSKLQYYQSLGDWILILHYKNGEIIDYSFKDSQNCDLRDYIIENGNNNSKIGAVHLIVSVITIIICFMAILVLCSLKITEKQMNKEGVLE